MNQIKPILEGIYNNLELRRTVVPLFMRNPGIGKTVLISEFAEEKGVKMMEFITSQRNPFEISGMAIPMHSSQKMTIYNYDEIDNLRDGDILFFDEVLNGNPTVLNACLTLLENRRMISGKKLPDIMIVAAANPQGAMPLTPQVKERFIWYKIKFNSSMWGKKMQNKYGLTTNMIEKLSYLIQNEDFIGENFCTPRSFDKNINMIINNVPSPYKDKLMPILGELITNNSENSIPLTKDGSKSLAPSESISWLKLIQYKHEIIKE